MSKAFSYLVRGICVRSGIDAEVLCVFIDGRAQLTSNDLFDELKLALKNLLTLPDAVMVISGQSGTDQLLNHWREDSNEREQFMARGERGDLPFVKDLQFACWKNDGQLVILKQGAGRHAFEWEPSLIMEAGLAELMQRNPVVQWSPGGHAFRHPSGTVNKVFAQARELASTEVELAFVARSLVNALPLLRDPALGIVFIDSMGIYSIVKEAMDFVGAKVRIESFHSYTELSKLSPPTVPHALIISASTTGGMAKRLISANGFSSEVVLTLVDRSRSADRGRVLIALDDIASFDQSRMSDGTETQIELIGEHFTYRSKPPRGVTISKRHEPKPLHDYLKCLGDSTGVVLNKAPSGKASPHLISFDGTSVAVLVEVGKWLIEQAQWRIPASIDTIIFVDDNGSEILGKRLSEALCEAKGVAGPLALIAADALNAAVLANSKGVAVVQAVAGDGGKLREVSRDLREYAPKLPRHFLIGLGVSRSAEAWERLRQFLERSAKPNLPYGFSTWISLPIGAEPDASVWKRYSELGAKLQTAPFDAKPSERALIEASIKLASDALDKSYQSFLSATTGKPLELTEGFVFFPKNLKPESASTVTVFLTIASVMQQARDTDDQSLKLKATGYESVVLDPENFHRFNDSILQACFLRAALPSELDYSSSPELSGLMAEFLAKLFSRHEHPYGEAAPEFAVALLSGRMRLVQNDLDTVTKSAVERLIHLGNPSSLLGFLFLIGKLP